MAMVGDQANTTQQSELTRLFFCFSLSRRPPSHLPSTMPFSSSLACLSDCCVCLCFARPRLQSLVRSAAVSPKPCLLKLFVAFVLLFCCMPEHAHASVPCDKLTGVHVSGSPCAPLPAP